MTGLAVLGSAGVNAGSPTASEVTPGVAPATEGARWTASKWGDPAADLAAKVAGTNAPDRDYGSLATVTTAIGARAAWRTTDAAGRAVTGAGVTVALLDTGIDTSTPGLDGAGQVLKGPDLSFETNSPELRGRDTFGHGTHLAGIIAARDAVPVDSTGQPRPADARVQLGVAPDARLLPVRLGSTDGSTDVSQVIAALDWVVQHRDDNGMPIRVVNLSYGTLSVQPYEQDPLAAAAENAWQHGIVVVVSGGNEGTSAVRLTDPAIDPYVLAVGASDPHGTPAGWSAPTVAAFSSRGNAARHVDLVAPGTSIASLRARGSFVDVNHPKGLVAGDTTGRLFRGSGTSQAAAVTSGAVALLLQAYPGLTPDQVKAALVGSARKLAGNDIAQGAGQVDVAAALVTAKKIAKQTAADRATTGQAFPAATGLGTLEGARGGGNLVDAETGAVLRGEVDVQNNPWNAAARRAASVAGTTWSGGRWNGATWTGAAWAGSSWQNAGWDGARWTGARWTDLSWTGARWTGARWTGARWTGQGWQ